MSEARTDRLEGRLDRLEEDVREIKTTLASLVPMINRIDATLPFLATKAELTSGLSDLRSEIAEVKVALADKPGRLYLWGVVGAMVGGQAVILAAAALGLVIIQAPPRPALPPLGGPHANFAPAGIVLAGETFDWDRYHERQNACRELSEAQRACAAGGVAICDQATLDRLQRQCSAFGPLGQRPR